MPGFDGTGPAGGGVQTGLGMGRCSGNNFSYRGRFGCGRGFGRARGRGWFGALRGMGLCQPMSLEEEEKALEAELEEVRREQKTKEE